MKQKINKFLSEFYISLRILMPDFWVMLARYNRELDEFILSNLSSVKVMDKYTALVNGRLIWIANYPYGFSNPYHPYYMRIRASRRTIFLLRNLTKAQIKQLEQEKLNKFLKRDK